MCLRIDEKHNLCGDISGFEAIHRGGALIVLHKTLFMLRKSLKSKITKISNAQKNSNQKVPNQMAKSKAQIYQTVE